MIQVEELRAGYRTGFRRVWREVIQGISFHVPRGSITGYLGVNGAGKTTTIKVLVGVNAPSGGRAFVAGHAAGSTEAALRLGYAPEQPSFYDSLTARELLAFYARLGGLSGPRVAARGDALLREVDLAAHADTPVRGFSKGMRQRLGLAQALVHDPELLVLDEPLDGLDAMGRLHLREVIAKQRERGRTVFFSSHVLSDVERVCDRLVVLDGGHVAYDGPTADFGADRVSVAVEVTVRGLEDAAAVAAAAKGVEAARAPDGSTAFRCPDQAAADLVVDAARARGASVVGVVAQRPSLEQAFMARFSHPAQAEPRAEAPAR